MIISFAWTTPALLAGAKTMTRRDWTHEYAARFHAGDLVDAWNQTPRVNSRRRGIQTARKVATIRITRDPYRQTSDAVPLDDYRREGFLWLDAHGFNDRLNRIVGDWSEHPRDLWVVEFEVVSLVDDPANTQRAYEERHGNGPNGDGSEEMWHEQ